MCMGVCVGAFPSTEERLHIQYSALECTYADELFSPLRKEGNHGKKGGIYCLVPGKSLTYRMLGVLMARLQMPAMPIKPLPHIPTNDHLMWEVLETNVNGFSVECSIACHWYGWNSVKKNDLSFTIMSTNKLWMIWIYLMIYWRS